MDASLCSRWSILGGRVTLTCVIQRPSPVHEEYRWFRGKEDQPEELRETSQSISVSRGGEYSCRGQTQFGFTARSLPVSLKETELGVASLSLWPPWPQLFSGEQLCLSCRAHRADAEWMFEWSRSGQRLDFTQSEVTIRKAAVRDTGSYRCRGVLPHTVTEWSPVISLKVSQRASVGPEHNSFSLQGLNHSAVFVCRATRGSPAFFSEYSDPSFVWSEAAPVSKTGLSSVPVMWVVGPVCSVVSLILLLLLWSCTKTKEKSRSVELTVVNTLVEDRVTLGCSVEDWKENVQWFFRNRSSYPYSELNNDKSVLTVSRGGVYSCRGAGYRLFTGESKEIAVESFERPCSVFVIRSSEVLPVGGRVTLTCVIQRPSPVHEEYRWFRGKEDQPEELRETSQSISVSRGGEYSCRGQTQFGFIARSLPVSLKETELGVASLSLWPPWPQLFSGEQLCLFCRAHRADAEWMFEWSRSGQRLDFTQSEVTIRKAAVRDTGSYRCRGVLPHTVTEWSPVISLKVSQMFESWLRPGASVSLNCTVTAPSAGWIFHWYRAVPHSKSFTYERLPGASVGPEHNSFSLQGLNHSAAFVCRATRGSPAFFSEYSDPSFVWSEDAASTESLSVSPDRTQHFTDDIISLSCGFNSTGAEYERYSDNKLSAQTCRSMRKDKCDFSLHEKTSAVFWCESRTGEMSNAINISAHSEFVTI
uniref:Ig-like domain-containing protein n=1 Tax=Knipowitschia caucasica TaxID=637954 RepID=A0AAV2KNF3_KNICA